MYKIYLNTFQSSNFILLAIKLLRLGDGRVESAWERWE